MPESKLKIPRYDLMHPVVLKSKIRRHFEEKLNEHEEFDATLDIHILGQKCYVTVGKPKLHDNPFHRLEFETEEHNYCYRLVRGMGNQVVEA